MSKIAVYVNSFRKSNKPQQLFRQFVTEYNETVDEKDKIKFTTLVRSVCTRWTAVYRMLQRILAALPVLKRIQTELGQCPLLTEPEETVLRSLVPMLNELCVGTTVVQTLHVGWVPIIVQQVRDCLTDTVATTVADEFRRALLGELNFRFPSDCLYGYGDLVAAAIAVDPRVTASPLFSRHEFDGMRARGREIVFRRATELVQLSVPIEPADSEDAPPKRKKSAKGWFRRLVDPPPPVPVRREISFQDCWADVDTKLQLATLMELDTADDIIVSFWVEFAQRGGASAALATAALEYLSVRASSAPLESFFSELGNRFSTRAKHLLLQNARTLTMFTDWTRLQARLSAPPIPFADLCQESGDDAEVEVVADDVSDGHDEPEDREESAQVGWAEFVTELAALSVAEAETMAGDAPISAHEVTQERPTKRVRMDDD